MEASAESARSASRRRVLPALGAAVVLAALVGAVAWTARDSRDDRTPGTPTGSAQATDTLDVVGRLVLGGGYDAIGYTNGYSQSTPGSPCYGKGGFDDIADGAQVVIESDGQTVGLGRLGGGTLIDTLRCSFPFTVTDVPRGHAFYTVEVSHRGGLTYTEADLGEVVVVTLN